MSMATRTVRKVINRIELKLGRPTDYDRSQNAEARRAYAAIVAQESARALSDPELRRIAEYARQILGSEVYAPWLEVYAAFRGSFLEGWLPDNYVGRYLVPYSVDRFGVCASRTLAARLFQTELMPDIAYRIRGAFCDRSFEPIPTVHLLDHVFAEHPVVYVKQDGSGRGAGVRRAERATFAEIVATTPADLAVQRPLRHAAFFEALSPTAVATLRLTTARDVHGATTVRAAYLRLGRDRDTVVSPGTSVRVAVDRATGRLQDHGVLPDWTRTERHPDTGAPFAGETIPHFAHAVEAVQALHARVPHIAYLGWDVCITDDEGVQIFEVNAGHADVKFSEAATGPIFANFGWDRLHETGMKPTR